MGEVIDPESSNSASIVLFHGRDQQPTDREVQYQATADLRPDIVVGDLIRYHLIN